MFACLISYLAEAASSGRFPSPVACGKRKADELAAAAMLAQAASPTHIRAGQLLSAMKQSRGHGGGYGGGHGGSRTPRSPTLLGSYGGGSGSGNSGGDPLGGPRPLKILHPDDLAPAGNA